MISFKIFCIFVLCFAGAASLAQNELSQVQVDLHALDKIALLSAAKMSPSRFQHLSIEKPSLHHILRNLGLPDIFSSELGVVFVDLLSLLFQLKKASPNSPLPELDYYYYADGGDCSGFFCFHLDINIDSGKTTLKGQQDFTSETVISPTSVEFKFKVPSFKWSSPEFVFNVSDRDYRQMYLTRDFHIDILNLEQVLSADYGFVEDVGIVLSNLRLNSSVDLAEFTFEANDVYDFDGNVVEKYGPLKYDLVEFLEIWFGDGGPQFAADFEFCANCIMSNGRWKPEECAQWNEDSGPFGIMYIVQFFHTAVMASMTRP